MAPRSVFNGRITVEAALKSIRQESVKLAFCDKNVPQAAVRLYQSSRNKSAKSYFTYPPEILTGGLQFKRASSSFESILIDLVARC